MSNEEIFEPDAFVIRTANREAKSYNNFQWPTEIGAMVVCPDWSPEPVCGKGLHGLLDGEGDWSLLSSDHDAIWQIVGVKRSECVVIDSNKVKFPRGKLVYSGKINGALSTIAKEWKRITQNAIATSSTTGEYSHSSTTGNRSHSSTTGYNSHSSTTGNRSHSSTTGEYSHSSTTGEYSHSSTTGEYSHSSTTGYNSHSSTTGNRSHSSTTGKNSVSASLGLASQAKAGEGGAIVVACYEDNYPYNLLAIRASKVGENGIKPDTWYKLDSQNNFVEVEL